MFLVEEFLPVRGSGFEIDTIETVVSVSEALGFIQAMIDDGGLSGSIDPVFYQDEGQKTLATNEKGELFPDIRSIYASYNGQIRRRWFVKDVLSPSETFVDFEKWYPVNLDRL